MEITFDYNPFPVHLPFHKTRAREKAAIGAVGSGKTIALCADGILLGLQQPGSRILIARQTIPSLKITTEEEFLSLLQRVPHREEGKKYTTLYDQCEIRRSAGHVDRLIFPNGTEYLFRSLDDWRKLMSLNLAAFYIDEASEIEAEAYLALLTRLRQSEPTQQAQRLGARKITRQMASICMNPNGHDWAWEYFVHGPEQSPELKKARRYFRSTSFDNPTLYNEDGTPGDYLQSLLTMPEIWVRRFVLCEFDAFEGQIYAFSPEYHVHTHFDPPGDWERAMGLDWGLRNPTAIVWWAREPGTRKWFQYREWQSYDPTDRGAREAHVTPTVHEVAAHIKSLEKNETIKWRVIDPSCNNRQADSGKSVMHWFRQYGLHFDFGVKDYSSRINAYNQMLARREISISTACPMTSIATQQYRWEDISATRDSDGPERPQKKNDHLVNAKEYLATLFARTTPPSAPTKVETFNDQVWKTVKKQIRRRSRPKPYKSMV